MSDGKWNNNEMCNGLVKNRHALPTVRRLSEAREDGVPMIFLILMSPPVINLTLSNIKSGKTTSVLKSIAHDSSSVRCSAK